MNTKKIIYILIAVVILAELIWAAYSLTKPVPLKKSIDTEIKTKKETGAKLELRGPKTASVGATFKVDVILSTTKPTGGADLIIFYDPKMLEPTVTLGKIYQEYPVNNVDTKQGKITITGLTNPSSKGFVGQDILSTMTFKAKSKGSTKISFDFTKGSTTNTNVSEFANAVNMLDEVSEYSINIQ